MLVSHAARAARLRLVIADCDGVLTDAGVYYGPEGELLKRFSIRDGMGVERLRAAGVDVAIMSGERSPSLKARARKLGIERLWLGVRDKRAQLDAALKEMAMTRGEVAFIGDDVNDLGVIGALDADGLTGAPGDAMSEVARAVHHHGKLAGGHGAFREFAEWILGLRGEGALAVVSTDRSDG